MTYHDGIRFDRYCATTYRAAFLWVATGLAVVCNCFANHPVWWSQQGVLNGQPPDDYAAANIGQLKHIASQAAAVMNNRLTGGAGNAINGLVASFSGGNQDNYAILNQGQLKHVAQYFYDRLAQINYGGPPLNVVGQTYPWTSTTSDDDSYAFANLGQLKYVFSFDVPFGQVSKTTIAGPASGGRGEHSFYCYAYDAGGLAKWRVRLNGNDSQWTVITGNEKWVNISMNFVDSGSYLLRLEVENSAGVLTASEHTIVISGIDSSPPSVPSGLVHSRTQTSVTLTWGASQDNVGVVGYQVFRNGAFLTTTAGPVYTDSGLTPAMSYVYYIKAIDAAGNTSASSNTVNATTLNASQTDSSNQNQVIIHLPL